MRIAIVVVALALLVSTAAMAGPNDNSSSIGGPTQAYWAWYTDAYAIGGSQGTSPNTTIDVGAKVAPWCSETLAGSSINFDFKQTGTPLLSVGLLNTCFANFAYQIYITAGPANPACVITKMDLTTPTAYGTGQNFFGIDWLFQKVGDPSPTACTIDEPNNRVYGPTYNSGGAGAFNWFVRANTVQQQQPGTYTLDPIVVIEPVL